MGLRGIPETRSSSKIWKFPRICWCCRRADCVWICRPHRRRYNSRQRVGAGSRRARARTGRVEKGMSFVKERKQFGRPIAQFQGLQWMLADMAVALNAARLSLHQARLAPPVSGSSARRAGEDHRFRDGQHGHQPGAPAVRRQGLFGDYPLGARSGCPHVHVAGGTAQVLRTLVASRYSAQKFRRPATGTWRRSRLRLAAK